MQPGHAEQRTHDYVRHGTTTLFTPWRSRPVSDRAVKNRNRHQEFLAFFEHLAPPSQCVVHLVMDNYATHKRPEIRDWHAANPGPRALHPHLRVVANLVEVWFGIIERQAIRRDTFRSVRELMIKIRTFITGWNHRRHPFIWTNPPTRSRQDQPETHAISTTHH